MRLRFKAASDSAKPRTPDRFRRRPSTQSLETRDLMAVGAALDWTTGVLSIEGTTLADVARVDYATKSVQGLSSPDRTVVHVTLGIENGYTIRQDFPASSVKRVVFSGKAGNDLFATSTTIPTSTALTKGTVSTSLDAGNTGNATPSQLGEVGVFTVGSTDKVGVDYLYGGAAYRGQLAIYSLYGMENLKPGTAAYNKEAARRALAD